MANKSLESARLNNLVPCFQPRHPLILKIAKLQSICRNNAQRGLKLPVTGEPCARVIVYVCVLANLPFFFFGPDSSASQSQATCRHITWKVWLLSSYFCAQNAHRRHEARAHLCPGRLSALPSAGAEDAAAPQLTNKQNPSTEAQLCRAGTHTLSFLFLLACLHPPGLLRFLLISPRWRKEDRKCSLVTISRW